MGFVMSEQRYLIADLDGTLIPWEGVKRLGSFDSLKQLNRKLKENRMGFIILTGRSFQEVLDALREYPLPEPELIFSSAGAVLYRKRGRKWEPCLEHRCYLEKRNPLWNRAIIQERLSPIENLRNQGEIHQAPYKISYYLYTLDYIPVLEEMERLLLDLADTLSIQVYPEPELGWCYVDIMACESDKKGALTYLAARLTRGPYVFAGDSWNDRSAFLSDHPVILVNNTPEELKREIAAKRPGQFIASGEGEGRDGRFADGVLEGLESLGWIN